MRRLRTPSALLVTSVLGISCTGDIPRGPSMHDTFEGSALDRSRWSTCHWWAPEQCTIESNREEQWYLPGQVTVRDGALVLTADRSNDPSRSTSSRPFVSGMVTTGPQRQHGEATYAFTYGRVAVELELPRGRGLWPAVWLLPASTMSRPEIDLLEARGDEPDRWSFHLHPSDRSQPSRGGSVERGGLGRGRHTIALDWSPTRLAWSVDGTVEWSVSGSAVPDEPMYLVINLAVGGDYAGSPDTTTVFPARMTVYDVRVDR